MMGSVKMLNQIVLDADAGRFDLWGHSTVIDGGADEPIVARHEFDALHFAAGLTEEWPVGNAGLLHVYGYLLSAVHTPYGFKRDRWLDGSLADALGKPSDYFSLERAEEDDETVLQRATDAVLPHLEEPDPDRFDILSIDDGVPDSDAFFRTTVVHDDLADTAALAYGIHDGDRMRLITVFPLADSSDAALDALISEPPRMRYNAALPPLAPRSPLVRRAVMDLRD